MYAWERVNVRSGKGTAPEAVTFPTKVSQCQLYWPVCSFQRADEKARTAVCDKLAPYTQLMCI